MSASLEQLAEAIQNLCSSTKQDHADTREVLNRTVENEAAGLRLQIDGIVASLDILFDHLGLESRTYVVEYDSDNGDHRRHLRPK